MKKISFKKYTMTLVAAIGLTVSLAGAAAAETTGASVGTTTTASQL